MPVKPSNLNPPFNVIRASHVEFGVRDLVPLRWSLTDPQRQTLWGHPAPKSWFEEGSTFVDATPREPLLAAQPIVAR